MKTFVLSLGVLVLALSIMVAYQFVDHRSERREIQTALCAVRANFDARIATSEQYLKENPNGAPGISAAVIKQGIRDTKRSRDALANLDCPPPAR